MCGSPFPLWATSFLQFPGDQLRFPPSGIRVPETVQITIEMEYNSVILPQRSNKYIGKQMGFRTRFRLPIFLTFPMGKVKKTGSRNRVLKPLRFPMNAEHFFIISFAKKCVHHSLEIQTLSEREFRSAGNAVGLLEK